MVNRALLLREVCVRLTQICITISIANDDLFYDRLSISSCPATSLMTFASTSLEPPNGRRLKPFKKYFRSVLIPFAAGFESSRARQVPHAFQQRLSAEKTPTLGDALPAFEALIHVWEQQQADYPETADIIQQGLDKLGSYEERLEKVPAYALAMSEIIHPFVC